MLTSRMSFESAWQITNLVCIVVWKARRVEVPLLVPSQAKVGRPMNHVEEPDVFPDYALLLCTLLCTPM